jgi:hypothetical protein
MEGQTDRETNTMKIIVTFQNFANAPKNQKLIRIRGNFRNVVFTFYVIFNDDANACYCTDFNKTWVFSTDFRKINEFQALVDYVQWQPT